jgi:hypothetical protein
MDVSSARILSVDNFSCCKTTTVAYSNSIVIHYGRSVIVLIKNFFIIACVGYFHQTGKFAITEGIFLVYA